jgi:hypothetical protein
MKIQNKKGMIDGVALLCLLVLLSIIPYASASKSFEIGLTIEGLNSEVMTETYEGYEFNYTVFGDYSVELDEIRVVESEYLDDDSDIDKTVEGVFKAQLVSSSGSSISSLYFAPSFMVLSDPPVEVDVTEVLLYMEYSANARYLRVYRGNELKLEEDIQKLTCNNDGDCNNFETYLSCPDCKWYDEDTICNSRYDDLYCDLDCYGDSNEDDPEAECFKSNCNGGGGLTGGVCQRYRCYNGVKDELEEGIDCGGVCEDECPYDFCGDGICAEYEDDEICPEDCEEKPAVKSYIENLGTQVLQGYLMMTVEKQVGGEWTEDEVVVDDLADGTLRAIYPYEKLNLRDIFNSREYVAGGEGVYRLEVELVGKSGGAIKTKSGYLSALIYFSVFPPTQSNSDVSGQEWLSETKFKVELEGEEGTDGYVEIEVMEEPKSLEFDGRTLEKGKEWFYEGGKVKVYYKHSKHVLIVDFGEEEVETAAFEGGSLFGIVVAVFMLFLGILLVHIIMRWWRG